MEPRAAIPPIDELAGHAGFVRRLAQSLLGDATEAEDVAQDALVAVLERPPARGVPLRAWLGGIVRNLVRMRRRTAVRRVRRERSVESRSRFPAPAETASRLETQSRLVAALHRLDEPYRSTIVLRFLDEMSTGDIARRSGVPYETVRTRLKRGLARLREDLGRERRDWRAGLTLLVGLPAAAEVAAAGTAVATTGAAIMGKGLMVALPVLAILGIVLAVRSAGSPPDLPPPPERNETAVAKATIGDAKDSTPAGARSAAAPSSEASVRVSAPHAYRTILRGRLLDYDSRRTGGAVVSVRGLDAEGSTSGREETGLAGPDGRFEIRIPAIYRLVEYRIVRAIEVRVDDPYHLPLCVRVPVADDGDVELRMIPAGIVRGRVLSRAGTAVAGAIVSIHAVGGKKAIGPPIDETMTLPDGDGVYRLRSSIDGPLRVVAWAPGHGTATAKVSVRIGGESGAPQIVLPDADSIAGKVVHGSVEPTSLRVRARLEKAKRFDRGPYGEYRGRPERVVVEGDVARDGTFRLDGLVRGYWRLEVHGEKGLVHPDVTEKAGRRVRSPTKSAKLRISTSALMVFVPYRGGYEVRSHVEIAGRETMGLDFDDRRSRSLVLVEPGREYRLSLRSRVTGEALTRVVRAPDPGRVQEIVLQQSVRESRNSLAIMVRAPGKTPETIWLALVPEGETTARPAIRLHAGDDGRFVLQGPPAGTWRLVVRPESPWAPAVETVTIPGSGDVGAAVKVVPGGRLRLRVRDATGRPAAVPLVLKDSKDAPVLLVLEEEEAGAVTAVLKPGRYTLGIRSETIRFSIEAGKTVRRDVILP